MTADDFVQNFVALPVEERSKALVQLAQSATYSERQATLKAISDKNDIVPVLPLELIIHVFSHLHWLDAWALQLVNRRWRQILSSEQFQRAELSRWHTHEAADSGRSVESIARDSFRDRVRHMCAVRTGRPFTMNTLDTIDGGLKGVSDFIGNKIAYVCQQAGDSDVVIVRDLITGDATILRGEERERIMSVILTTTVVAFLTSQGHLYTTEFTHDLLLHKTSRIKLPSSQICGASGREGTIVLAMGAIQQGGVFTTEILIYETTTQRLRSFGICDTCQGPLGNARSLSNCGILVNSNRTIDIFSLMWDRNGAAEGKRFRLSSIRVSATDGQVLSTKRYSSNESLEFKPSYGSGRLAMFPPRPTGRKGEFQILVTEQPPLRLNLPIRVKHIAHFDAERAVFVDPDQDARLCQTAICDHGVLPLRSSSPFKSEKHYVRWKDLAVLGLQESQGWTQYIVLMNDAFMVSVETSRKGGLQEATGAAGDLIRENTDQRSSSSKKGDEASKSLNDFAKGAPGQTVSGTKIKGSDQVTNAQTGSADHLELGKGE
ncbi:hypothetical protein LTR37_011395 [Vermiconidia calcicola]|uniref:Uncharacterized protein n=1 Tax=Vermiconidia calcicola TaxID=1690605 RepID=A0ACC3N2A2_9PEZI|nr:hypothetical protein LTR37_011395 [Vermiconidia calcicola]